MIPEYAVATIVVESLAWGRKPFPSGWEHSDCIVTDRNPLEGEVYVKGEFIGTFVRMRAQHRMERHRRFYGDIVTSAPAPTAIDYIPAPWPMVG